MNVLTIHVMVMQLVKILLDHLSAHAMRDSLAVVLNVKVWYENNMTVIMFDNNEHCHIDINECDTDNGGCADPVGCMNTIGSFICTCPTFGSGFTANGVTCVGMFIVMHFVVCVHVH